MVDTHVATASAQVRAAVASGPRPEVRTFFDEATFTATHVVHDPETRRAAIVDSVLDFDAAAGRTDTRSADAIVRHVERAGLTVDWLLETHAHADHLSAAPHLQERLGGRLAIGRSIVTVQQTFAGIFHLEPEFARDGSQFDVLFDDGSTFAIGGMPAIALHVPGHTPADMAYVVGDAVFTGDTIFMPDYGTARADFPGGDARRLFGSIRRLLSLPGEARLYLCHDYKAPGRDAFAWETTVADERTGNIHVHDGVAEEEFVRMRTERDRTLSMPKLILPAIQVNIRGGRLPPPEGDGHRYLKLPLNRL